MSLYESDRAEIQKMIDKAQLEVSPEYKKEETKQIIIAVIGVLSGIIIVFGLFFGTIMYTSTQKTEREKYKIQMQVYGEEINKSEE